MKLAICIFKALNDPRWVPRWIGAAEERFADLVYDGLEAMGLWIAFEEQLLETVLCGLPDDALRELLEVVV